MHVASLDYVVTKYTESKRLIVQPPTLVIHGQKPLTGEAQTEGMCLIQKRESQGADCRVTEKPSGRTAV